MKLCKKCGDVKPFSSFSVDRKKKDGLQCKCKTCNAAYHAANREKIVAKASAWNKANPDKHGVSVSKWGQKNHAKRITDRAAHYRKNKSKVLADGALWKKANRHKVAAAAGKRKAAKLCATPAWADLGKVEEFYAAAQFLSMVTGEWYEVDHVVPLQAKMVCGLHVHTNLRVVTRTENRSKGHFRWPDMP